MSSRSYRFMPLMPGFRWQTCQPRHLPRAFETACCPLGPKDIFWWKICFSAESALAHTARTTQQFLAEFWTLADWPPYLPDLNLLDFSIFPILQVKVQVAPHDNQDALCPFPSEWDRRSTSTRPAANSPAARMPQLLKTASSLNRWTSNSPTHINQYSSGYHKLQWDMKSCTLKKYSLVHDWSPNPA